MSAITIIRKNTSTNKIPIFLSFNKLINCLLLFLFREGENLIPPTRRYQLLSFKYSQNGQNKINNSHDDGPDTSCHEPLYDFTNSHDIYYHADDCPKKGFITLSKKTLKSLLTPTGILKFDYCRIHELLTQCFKEHNL